MLISKCVYLVDWYLKTFLIKERDYDILLEEYNNFISKYTTNKTYLFFKRGSYFYLYIIICDNNISEFEAIGFFTILDEKYSLSTLYNESINKLLSMHKNY